MAAKRARWQAARSGAAAIASAIVFCGYGAGGQTRDKPGQDMQTGIAARVHNCAACHGANGISTSELFPNLAGQQKAYIIAQLKAFRAHTRQDRDAKAYMWGVAAGLNDDTITNLAAYFSAQSPAPTTNDLQSDTAAGEALYQHGALHGGVPACASCHGHKGEGNVIIPALSGQHADYLLIQLEAFSSGSRHNGLMNAIASKLTLTEKKSLVAYLASQNR